MKDVQEQVYLALKNVLNENYIFNFNTPTIFDNSPEKVIVFSELENEPAFYADGIEDFSLIYYDFIIYSKQPDTYQVRFDINDELTKIGFVRVSSGPENYLNNAGYYYRNLQFKIQI